MAKKTSIKGKLRSRFGIYFSSSELYKALCSYNDITHRIYTIRELETVLDSKDDLLEDFSEFLLNTFEPEVKFLA
jgi:hypothetical protein